MPTAQADRLETSDRELLDRYAHQRDEAAFDELIQRHGALVRGVCRRTLSCPHDAEDAAQSTFLVLAEQAASIRGRDALAAWLYGVAMRTALRCAVRKRRRREQGLEEHATEDDPLPRIVREDEHRLLLAELRRLPPTYRDPLVLHYLQGKSQLEVAATLGVTATVVKGRLQRARAELRARLSLRGMNLGLLLAGLAGAVGREALAEGGRSSLTLVDRQTRWFDEFRWSFWERNAAMLNRTICIGLLAGAMALATIGLLGSRGTAAAPGESSAILATSSATREATFSPPAILLAMAGSQDEQATGEDQSELPPAREESKAPTVVKHHDGKADGRKSLAGAGEMIRFTLPAPGLLVRGLRIHGSRYGYPQAPKEDFTISFQDEDLSEKPLHVEKAPYSRFQRGEAKWVTIRFKEPLELPETFWVTLDFNAEQTKGVYVSYDTSTGGEHSKIGLPGEEAEDVGFEGDWMIEALLTKDGKPADRRP
jgi:RNA polymerase sigma-70 factor (ECF subfamily)